MNQSTLNHDTTVNYLMKQGQRSWDVRKILDNFPREVAAKIIATPILRGDEQDKLIWPFSKHGIYDVKTGYHAEKDRRRNLGNNNGTTSNAVQDNFWKQIWNAKVPPKIKTFMWKACKNALPTKSNLHIRNLTDCSLCPVCHEATEDIEHLLLFCPWTRPIWFGSPLQ